MTAREPADSGDKYHALHDIAQQLGAIHTDLAGIKAMFEAAHQATTALQQQAQQTLQTHQQQAQAHRDKMTQEAPPDVYPFVSLPAGTQVRDLPDGHRLFILADGMMIKTNSDHTLAVTVDGISQVVTPGPGTTVTVSPGRSYTLVPTWIETTSEHAGIAGLPASAQVTKLAEQRFSIELEPYRLLIDHAARTLAMINPCGSIILLGAVRSEGIGDTVTVRPRDDGGQAFACADSGHRGVIEPDGTMHLALHDGSSLVVRFSDDRVEDAAAPSSQPLAEDMICQVRA